MAVRTKTLLHYLHCTQCHNKINAYASQSLAGSDAPTPVTPAKTQTGAPLLVLVRVAVWQTTQRNHPCMQNALGCA